MAPNNGYPLQKLQELMRNRTCTFKLRAFHPDEVLKILNKLNKNSKSCGLDTIDAYVLSLAKEELLPVITHIVNLSITEKCFPTEWKCAKVIPLHKKNEVTYPMNYRPVALLPIISKIVERVVYLQLSEYLEENDLLHPSHHGFRSKHNTSTALLHMVDTWMEALENDEISAVIMLDMSAAFDTIQHDILVSKMKLYGLENCALSWVKSYLSGRSQAVYIDGALSDTLDIETGVPQGSVLGPLFYIIFTSDLPEIIHSHVPSNNQTYNAHCEQCGNICCFADDSTFSKCDKDPLELKRSIDETYQQIDNYMSMNRLILNSDKTHLLVMCTDKKHRIHGDFNITLNTGSEIIKPISSAKLLGGIVSNDLKWNHHIKEGGNRRMKGQCLEY